MKKSLIKISTLIVALTLAMGSVACTKKPKGDDEKQNATTTSKIEFEGVHEVEYERTDYDFIKNGATDYVLIIPYSYEIIKNTVVYENVNKRSDLYNIMMNIKEDFVILFEKATGIKLEVKYDNEISDYSSTDKYISFGTTKLVEQAGIDEEEYDQAVLGDNGIRLLTVDRSIFVLGNASNVMQGAYRLLELCFHYDAYFRNCIEIDTGVTDLKLYDFDVLDIPDIQYTYHVSANGLANVIRGDYAGLGPKAPTEIKFRGTRVYGTWNDWGYNELCMKVYAKKADSDFNGYERERISRTIHTELYYVNSSHEQTGSYTDVLDWYNTTSQVVPEEPVTKPTEDQVKKWYASTTSDRLCYTCQGDAQAREALINHFVEKIKYSMKIYDPEHYPFANNITITKADTQSCCTCAECKRVIAANGNANVAPMLIVVNEVGRRIQAWLDEINDPSSELYETYHKYYRPDFKIYTFAYNNETSAPAIKNEDGTFSPATDEVICPDNVGVWHCEGYNDGRFDGIHDVTDPSQQKGMDEYEAWAVLTKHKWGWINTGNITNYFYLFDNLGGMNNNYFALKAKYGCEMMYVLTSNGSLLSSWTEMFKYIMSKLSWDVNIDIDYYVKKYMFAMYEDAGQIMYDLYKEEMNYFQTQVIAKIDSTGVSYSRGGNVTGPTYGQKYYPYEVLRSWLAKIDLAEQAVKKYELTDPAKYELLVTRMEMEAVVPTFCIIDIYAGASSRPYSDAELVQYRKRLKGQIEFYPTNAKLQTRESGGVPLYDYT